MEKISYVWSHVDNKINECQKKINEIIDWINAYEKRKRKQEEWFDAQVRKLEEGNNG